MPIPNTLRFIGEDWLTSDLSVEESRSHFISPYFWSNIYFAWCTVRVREWGTRFQCAIMDWNPEEVLMSRGYLERNFWHSSAHNYVIYHSHFELRLNSIAFSNDPESFQIRHISFAFRIEIYQHCFSNDLDWFRSCVRRCYLCEFSVRTNTEYPDLSLYECVFRKVQYRRRWDS